jgi:hypothetical protein
MVAKTDPSHPRFVTFPPEMFGDADIPGAIGWSTNVSHLTGCIILTLDRKGSSLASYILSRGEVLIVEVYLIRALTRVDQRLSVLLERMQRSPMTRIKRDGHIAVRIG